MSDPTAPHEESVGVYEMLWDCPSCDTKGNLGKTHRFCPNCGAPQDETKRYMPDATQRVAVADHQYAGVDRKCGSCGAPQSAKAKNCGNCGAPLDGAATVPLVGVKEAPKKKPFPWWWIVLAVFAFGFLIWFVCIRKKTVDMQIAGHRWATEVTIEEYRNVGEEQWRDQVPGGAQQLSCTRKQRSTRQVQDGEECTVTQRDKGDGTFEDVKSCKPKYRSEGVDDDWCRYTIDKWTKVDALKKDGRGLSIVWAEPPTPTGPQSGLGARRVGEKKATYTLELNDGKKVRTCDVSEGTWKKYVDQQRIKMKVRATSGELVCSSL